MGEDRNVPRYLPMAGNPFRRRTACNSAMSFHLPRRCRGLIIDHFGSTFLADVTAASTSVFGAKIAATRAYRPVFGLDRPSRCLKFIDSQLPIDETGRLFHHPYGSAFASFWNLSGGSVGEVSCVGGRTGSGRRGGEDPDGGVSLSCTVMTCTSLAISHPSGSSLVPVACSRVNRTS